MTKRYRFYNWSVDESGFLKLRQRIPQDTYTEDTGQGFHLLRSTRYEIEGRFVQRIVYAEEIVSPDGVLSTSERTSYIHTNFRLRPGVCGLLLVDSPRSVSALLHRLSQLLDYDVAVQAAKINLIKFKSVLQGRFGKALVTSVKIAGAVLAENAVADISVVDPRDALESALTLFPNHQNCIGRLDLSFSDVRLSKVRISATRTGSIRADAESSEIVDGLWEAVVEANG